MDTTTNWFVVYPQLVKPSLLEKNYKYIEFLNTIEQMAETHVLCFDTYHYFICSFLRNYVHKNVSYFPVKSKETLKN